MVMPSMRSWQRGRQRVSRQRRRCRPRCAYLVGSHVSLQQRVLLLQVLDAGQVLAVVVRGQVALHLVQPQLDVLHVPVELLLLVGLAELETFRRKSSSAHRVQRREEEEERLPLSSVASSSFFHCELTSSIRRATSLQA